MEISLEGEFLLQRFSPQTLTYVPDLNCVLVSNRRGEVRCIDVVTGDIQKCQGKCIASGINIL